MVGSRGAHLEPEYTGKLDKKGEEEPMRKQSSGLGLITDPRSMKKHDHDDDDDNDDGDADADGDGDGRDEQCSKVPCFSLSGDASIKDTPHLNMFLTEPKKNCPKNWMVQHSKIRNCVCVLIPATAFSQRDITLSGSIALHAAPRRGLVGLVSRDAFFSVRFRLFAPQSRSKTNENQIKIRSVNPMGKSFAFQLSSFSSAVHEGLCSCSCTPVRLK